MKVWIFIAISFVLGLLCIRHIRGYDKHEQEPFLKMFGVTLWGGVWSVAISLLLYAVLARLGLRDLRNSFGALLVVGPVEEFAKLFAMASAYFIYSKELDEPVDGMIYMACVALGFSLIENFFYALRPNAGHLLFVRILICTPMHICFSAFMGLALYMWLKNKRAFGLLVISFVLASVSHGVYDLIVFSGMALFVLYLVVRTLYRWTMDLLSYAVAQSPLRVSLTDFVRQYPNPVEQEGLECLYCNSRNPKLTFSMGRFRLQKCDNCEHYVVTKKGLVNIFHHFAATFRSLKSNYYAKGIKDKNFSVLFDNNFVSDARKLAFFDLEKLNGTLEKLNHAIAEKMEAHWWFPNNLLQLDQEDQSLDYKQIVLEGGGDFWRWLIYPFSSDKAKKLNALPEKRPSWNWGAFLIPELWFLYHEIWGIFFIIAAGYMTFLFSSIFLQINPFGTPLLFMLLAVRLISGRYGSEIYFVMHGRWPNPKWNGETDATSTKL